jgi:hypothetical protein
MTINNNNVSEIDNFFLSLCANFIIEHNGGTSVLLAHTQPHPPQKKFKNFKKLSKMIRIPALSGGILPEKKKIICVNGVSMASMTPLNTYVPLSAQRSPKKKN